jgi:hypothetical protein
VIADDVQPRGRNDGGEARHERQRRKRDGGGAIAVRFLERDGHAAVGQQGQPVVGERRAQDVAADRLAPALVVPVHVGLGVQREPATAQPILGSIDF